MSHSFFSNFVGLNAFVLSKFRKLLKNLNLKQVVFNVYFIEKAVKKLKKKVLTHSGSNSYKLQFILNQV
jgi:hypothetical protein